MTDQQLHDASASVSMPYRWIACAHIERSMRPARASASSAASTMWWRSTSKKRRKRGARVAAAEAVGAERGERRLAGAGDELRPGAHVVARGDHRRVAGQAALHVALRARLGRDAGGSSARPRAPRAPAR